MKYILIIEDVFFLLKKDKKKTAENKQTQRDGHKDCFETIRGFGSIAWK